VRFMAIFASNLDEFFMVRVAGRMRRMATGLPVEGVTTGMPADQVLEQTLETARELSLEHAEYFNNAIRPALAQEGIEILRWKELTASEQADLQHLFRERIYPVLTPLVVDPSHPFPYISNLTLSLAVMIADPATGATLFARVKIPPLLPRFLTVAPHRFVPLEDVIAAHLGELFVGMDVLEHHVFRITRIRDVDPLLFGCQDGIGILVGRRFEFQVGTATIRNNSIDLYQKGGIVVDNADSYALVTQNDISGEGLSDFIAQNGVQIGRGASADVHHNRISKNLFKRVGSTDTASGVLLFETSAHVSADHNDVFQNGVGIDIDADTVALVIAYNNVHENFDNGVAAFAGSQQNQIAYNKAFDNTPVDCYDETAGGGTAETANFWVHDMGGTENRPGLCKSQP